MDIKDLNKPQMILLVMLVSFVISIGTGVSVVSLMQPEPTTVTQTINRVIQHTIQNVENTENINTASEEKDTNGNQNISSELKPLVDFYSFPKSVQDADTNVLENRKFLGKAVLISENGILLVDSTFVKEGDMYQVVLDQDYFNIEIVSKMGDVYVMQVVSKADKYIKEDTKDTTIDTQ